MERKIAIILAVMVASLAIAAVVWGQAAPNPTTQGSLRILAPQTGEKVNTTFVNVRFELENTGAAANVPNFRVQLDSRDPVITTATDHTFTGLRPGNHVIRVELVDANNTPIAGLSSEVQFIVVPGPGSPGSSLRDGGLRSASLTGDDDDDQLPNSGSELPLLSVIGFGVLVGGIISAMRTR